MVVIKARQEDIYIEKVNNYGFNCQQFLEITACDEPQVSGNDREIYLNIKLFKLF